MKKNKWHLSGKYLRHIRETSGLTQTELSLLCRLSRQYINRIEAGSLMVTKKVLKTLDMKNQSWLERALGKDLLRSLK